MEDIKWTIYNFEINKLTPMQEEALSHRTQWTTQSAQG